VNVGVVIYWNPSDYPPSGSSILNPVNLRTVIVGNVFDDTVPFISYNGETDRIELGGSKLCSNERE
jgi:hypothetical protein